MTIDLQTGDSEFKIFIFVTLPSILSFYVVCLYLALRNKPGTVSGRLRNFFSLDFGATDLHLFGAAASANMEKSILMRGLYHALLPACCQGMVGTFQVLNNILSGRH